ncbi:GH24916 [Drosophila grimshawi]|uniref:GH24916 n=1 Tax=Drosophila grimshawi TaxID=7222 RepID=B4JNY5_DROGR|nr:GH24916 [Drosophila grimshawi]
MNKKPSMPLASFLSSDNGNISNISNISNCATTATGNNVAGSSSRIGRQSGSSMCFASGATNGAQGASNSSSAVGGNGTTSSASKADKQRDGNGNGNGNSIISSILCGCQRAPKSHCISATGVLLLVLLYTAMGSIIFVTLEGELEDATALETAVAASKPYPRTELANAEIRSRTVDRLWSITEDLNILYKENWTRLAAQEVQLFQDTLLRAVRQSKVYQPGGVQMNAPTHKWTYASAFLYSLTLITTIGECSTREQ